MDNEAKLDNEANIIEALKDISKDTGYWLGHLSKVKTDERNKEAKTKSSQ